MIDQDKIAFILAKQCYEQTQGEWEPSMGQSHDMVDAILQELSDDTPAQPNWQPIATAPVGKKMFVAIAMDIDIGGGNLYTTDPWCVWQSTADDFSRWVHPFAPTHWMPLPEVTQAQIAAIDEIDWRQMFLEVHDRMRKAGESKEMGARWFSESARAALKEAK